MPKEKKEPLYIVSFSDEPSQYIVNIAGLDKREVFRALFARASPYLGSESDWDDAPLTDDDFAALEAAKWNVVFYRGRCMSVDLSGDSFNSFMYDRHATYRSDSGRAIIAGLRKKNLTKNKKK